MTKRYIGVDVGTRRVGLAVSDDAGIMALPHSTWSPKESIEAIVRLVEELDAQAIVVGWPLELSGREGPATEKVKRFLKKLENSLEEEDLDVDVETWDERLTTTSAEARLIEADLSRRKRRRVIDQVAASHILQGFLEAERIQRERDAEDADEA